MISLTEQGDGGNLWAVNRGGGAWIPAGAEWKAVFAGILPAGRFFVLRIACQNKGDSKIPKQGEAP
jgi:hypothetical protein